jgi:hypothetical protein
MDINCEATGTRKEERMRSVDKTDKTETSNPEPCDDPAQDSTSCSELCNQFNTTKVSEEEDGGVPGFGQVVEMISKGLPLPGVTDLGIKPLDVEPTIARMERKSKPWEQG